MKRKGYTLMEVILVIGILGVVIAAIISVLTSTFKIYDVSNEFANLQKSSITLSRLISNEIQGSTKLYIYEKKPAKLPSDISGYIYHDTDSNIIYIKRGEANEEVLFTPNGTEQFAYFSKVNDNNVSVDLDMKKDEIEYNNVSNVALLKSKGVVGTSGRFIAFSFIHEDPLITSFNFLVENNSNLNESSYGIIKDNTIFLYVDMNTNNIGEFIPKIAINGDEIFLGDKDGSVYNINNPTKIDFNNSVENPVKMTVRDGELYKEYFITVQGQDTIIFPNVIAKDIVPTYKDQSPTDASKINMPNKEDTLNAIFEFEEVNYSYDYQVVWYGVNPEQIDSYEKLKDSFENPQNYDIETVTILNSPKLCIADSPEYNKLSGRYVYFEVMGVDIDSSETGESSVSLSIADTEPSHYPTSNIKPLTDLKQPFVFVGFKYGKVFETTLNEIDYLEGNSFKRYTIHYAYNRIPSSSRNSYSGNQNYVTKSGNLVSSVKVILPGYSTTKKIANPNYSYKVDFVNREVTITGASGRLYKQRGYSNQQLFQFGLLVVNMYDNFYIDRRVNRSSTVRVGVKNKVDSNGNPLLGGVAVSTTPQTIEYGDNNVGWDAYFVDENNANLREIEYWDGYHANLIFGKSKYHEPGVNYINHDYSRSCGNYDNKYYIDLQYAERIGTLNSYYNYGLVGARNPENLVVPYLFKDIEKDGFTINPNDENDVYMDIKYTYNSNTNRYFTVQLMDRKDINKKTYPMYFGNYKNSSGQYIYNYGDENEHKVYMSADGAEYTFKDYDSKNPNYPYLYSDVLKMFEVETLEELKALIGNSAKTITDKSDEIVEFRIDYDYYETMPTFIGTWAYNLDSSKNSTTEVTLTELTSFN